MTQQFLSSGVPLFKASGVPAMDPNCCCEEVPCVCSVPNPELAGFGGCDCFTSAFGTRQTQPDITITPTIVTTPYALGFPSPYGCAAPGTCPAFAGSIVIPCGTGPSVVAIDYVEVCTPAFNTAVDYFIQVRIASYGSISVDSGWCTRTISTGVRGFLNIMETWTAFHTPSLPNLDQYEYVPSAECREECNTINGYAQCRSGSGAASDAFTLGPATSNCCSLVGSSATYVYT